MEEILPPVTIRSRPLFQLYLWLLTAIVAFLTVALLLRAMSWMPLLRSEPTLLALFLPFVLLLALTLWLGRWALYHSTVRVTVDEAGLTMRSAVASDTLAWENVEALRLQMTSGSEAQLSGGGHRVTIPSGSAPPPAANQQLQAWISYKLGEREIAYGDEHFWGP